LLQSFEIKALIDFGIKVIVSVSSITHVAFWGFWNTKSQIWI